MSLIKEYESEEKEVKDLEWVKAKLKKDHKDGEVGKSQIKDGEKIDGIDLNSYWRGRQTANYIARCYLEDLDEPETLSEDWIQEHSYNVHLLGTPDVTTVAVPREDLQNLLVANQDEPETLSEPLENVETFSNAMEQLADELNRLGDLERDIENLTGMTLEQIAEEVRNGGIVPKQEKEQKYNVRFKVKSSFGTVGIFLYKEGDEVLAGDNFKAYYPKEEECRLTEQEIRGFQNGDILFEHFAVKAEELEE